MKKLLLLSSIIMVGCSTPEQPKPKPDCRCWTVIDGYQVNIINATGANDVTSYLTIKNDCTGGISSTHRNGSFKIGEHYCNIY